MEFLDGKGLSKFWSIVKSYIHNADISGNAATATKATQDSNGNVITSTYVKDINGGSSLINVSKGDNTSISIPINLSYDSTSTEFLGDKTVNSQSYSTDILNISNYDIIKYTLTSDSTITLPTGLRGDRALLKTLIIINQGNHTVTWVGNIKWTQGIAPALNTETNIVELLTLDGGSSWLGLNNVYINLS